MAIPPVTNDVEEFLVWRRQQPEKTFKLLVAKKNRQSNGITHHLVKDGKVVCCVPGQWVYNRMERSGTLRLIDVLESDLVKHVRCCWTQSMNIASREELDELPA